MDRLVGVGLDQIPEGAEGQGSGAGGVLTRDRKWMLVLIDGTWAQAKRMVRDSPHLSEYTTQVCFQDAAHSAFDAVRKEPDEHCVSTLEACARALRLLEPDSAAVETAASYLEVSKKNFDPLATSVSACRSRLDCMTRPPPLTNTIGP